MRIISLDQNAISFLAKGNQPFWRELRESLLAGVKTGKFLCPIPKETIYETIPCSLQNVRIKIRDLYQELSLGYSFKPFGAIEGEETLKLVRPGIRTCSCERIVWHSVEDDALVQTKAKEIHDTKDFMQRRGDDFVHPSNQNKFMVKEMRSDIIALRRESLKRQIERLLTGQPLNPTDHLQFALCRFLVSRGVTKVELEQLREKILMREWEAIPAVFFAAALGALLDYDRINGRKYDANDEIDIERIAIALHSADMMITERYMANVVRQLEKECGERLNVFAINEHEAIKASLEKVMAK